MSSLKSWVSRGSRSKSYSQWTSSHLRSFRELSPKYTTSLAALTLFIVNLPMASSSYTSMLRKTRTRIFLTVPKISGLRIRYVISPPNYIYGAN